MNEVLSITQLKTNIIEIMGKILDRNIPSNEVIRSLVGCMSDIKKNITPENRSKLAEMFGEVLKLFVINRGFEDLDSLFAARASFATNAFLTRLLDSD